jgi:serine/threonine protein kinase
MAPEVIKGGESFDGEKSDIFNLGVMLFIMAFGRPPFSNAKSCDRLYRLLETKQQDFFKWHPITKEAAN